METSQCSMAARLSRVATTMAGITQADRCSLQVDFPSFRGRQSTTTRVTAFICRCPSQPILRPSQKCKSVIAAADSNCSANASVDDGSFDPDGDSITLTQSPAGPYPLGELL